MVYEVGEIVGSANKDLACKGGKRIVIDDITKLLSFKKEGAWSYKGIDCLTINQSYCKLSCKDGFYAKPLPGEVKPNYTVISMCEKCHEACTKCTGPDTADCDPDSCILGYSYFEGKCKAFCHNGEYWSDVTDKCEKCNNKCLLCYDEISCLKCDSGFRNFFKMKYYKNIYKETNILRSHHECKNKFISDASKLHGIPIQIGDEIAFRNCDDMIPNCKRCVKNDYRDVLNGLMVQNWVCIECNNDVIILDVFKPELEDLYNYTYTKKNIINNIEL